MMGWSRNLNYVGEMMLYSAFAILCQRVEVWFIYAYVWGVFFTLRMMMKEYSNSKKIGWTEYANQTWYYIPKLYNSAFFSYLFYGTFGAVSYYTYTNGGIEATAKQVIQMF